MGDHHSRLRYAKGEIATRDSNKTRRAKRETWKGLGTLPGLAFA
jgi:hypothetical protein